MTDEDFLCDSGELARLGAHVAEISTLVAAADGAPDVRRVLALAAAVLPHALHAGLTVRRENGAPETVAGDDELPARIDLLQHRLRQGPFVDATAGAGDVVVTHDLRDDRRWPEFAPRCLSVTGIRSILSVRVPLTGPDRAALSFYATSASAFDDLDVGVASIFPPFAAMAVHHQLHEREVAQLGAALDSSRQIGAAVGILMAQHRVTSADAFGLLTETSQHLNRKLREIAAEVALTGELPPVRVAAQRTARLY